MQRAGAAIGHQHVVAWIMAAPGRYELDGAYDIGLSERDRAVGRSLERETESLRDRLESTCSRVGVNLHASAEEGFGSHRAAHHMGVGERRLRPAARVAGGAWIGTGRARADPQHAALIEPNDRSAP